MTNDCDNLKVRDALPDMAAGVLAAADAAAIDAHVDGCESCRTELLLIRTVRDDRGAVRAMDVASIVRALPAPRRSADVVDIASRRRTRAFPMQWRAAAAALVVAAGSLGIAVSRHATQPVVTAPVATVAPTTAAIASVPPTVVAPSVDVPSATPAVSTSPARTMVATSAATPAPALLVAGAAHDLQTAEQRQLLKDLESFDGSVSEDVESSDYDLGGTGL